MLTRYTKKFVGYLRNNKAVSALEYALLVGIIAVAMSAAIFAFSGNMKDAVDKIGAKVKGAGTQVDKGVTK